MREVYFVEAEMFARESVDLAQTPRIKRSVIEIVPHHHLAVAAKKEVHDVASQKTRAPRNQYCNQEDAILFTQPAPPVPKLPDCVSPFMALAHRNHLSFKRLSQFVSNALGHLHVGKFLAGNMVAVPSSRMGK